MRALSLVSILVALTLVTGCAGTRAGSRNRGPALQEMAGEYRAVVAADLDGETELFALDVRKLLRICLVDGQWQVEQVWRSVFGTDWYGMTAGDVDADGRDELVLWGFRPQLISVVLGDSDGELVKEAGPTPLLLRVAEQDGQTRLFGQRPGSESPFKGAVHHYTIEDGAVQRGAEQPGWAGWNVLEFVYGPSESGEALYAWDDRGAMERWESEAVVWRGDAVRMSRPLSRERERANLLGERRTELDTYPTLPHLADVDGDGVDEVLVVVSDPAGAQVLERVRTFRGGTLRVLEVGERGLTTRVTSILLGRFLTGITTVDLDGDGTREALTTVVLRRRSGVGPGRSALAAFDLDSGDLLPIGRPAEESD